MQVGDLVRLSKAFSNLAVVQDWGCGIIEEVQTESFIVKVVWPHKSPTSHKLPWSRVEVVNEGR